MSEPVEVAPGVRRITCGNPSPMTAEGTQSYLVGRREVLLIDPGPEDAAHRAALLAALGTGRLAAILVTHSHRDHSAGAPALAAATGAPVLAFGPHGAGMSETMRRLAARGGLGGGEGADEGFAPDRLLADGDEVATGEARLSALHTPGHISNHLCFALEGEGVLFTGDTAMGWSSTLVSPPEGDMAALMASLQRLAARDDRLYLPGHGGAVTDPRRLVAEQIAHREARAAAIRAALAEGPASAADLTPRIYADTPLGLHPAAMRNLLATLIWRAEAGELRALGEIGPDCRFAPA
ncbi:MBL fold metallo-hydrolase [Paralimibaculum aggregatum]|uniref:MBL fold metallo-hydrolase n=1 Tax=Paralimibaculum aggregatum TaxID=3036245 RepID=A0ABQ6LQ22_9RHOB|nr:MBL fold metallo-hydrolase [Limibaculum sp. NKW23]GMG82540.1 MBL fold metallo-hydrolase [Limibaculum sp. NKW23]